MNMILSVIGILIALFSAGCTDSEAAEEIEWFDRYFTPPDVRTVVVFGYSTEGGIAHYYHRDGEVEMIDATFYGEMGYSRSQFLRIGRGLLVRDSSILYVRPFYLEGDPDPAVSRREVQVLQFPDVAEIPDSSVPGRLYLELIEIFESGVKKAVR